MRAYTIKRKGATLWYNIYLDKEISFDNGNKMYVGRLFFRKKDAKQYLDTMEHKQYFEVVGLTIDKSKTDNRLRS
jgi:hypothetical protein